MVIRLSFDTLSHDVVVCVAGVVGVYADGGPGVGEPVDQFERSLVPFQVGADADQPAQARSCLGRLITVIEMTMRIDHTVSIAGSSILGGRVMTVRREWTRYS